MIIKRIKAGVTNKISVNASAHDIITHDSKYSPVRYGDIVAGKVEGDSLYVKGANIEPQFEQLVKDRRLPDRSIAISPTDTGYRLDHLAWLGAEPPAVKGLEPVTFMAHKNTLYFNAREESYRISNIAGLFRGIRDWIIEQTNAETAENIIPDHAIKGLNDDAASEEVRNRYKDAIKWLENIAASKVGLGAQDTTINQGGEMRITGGVSQYNWGAY